jgi:hypothetical protein
VLVLGGSSSLGLARVPGVGGQSLNGWVVSGRGQEPG